MRLTRAAARACAPPGKDCWRVWSNAVCWPRPPPSLAERIVEDGGGDGLDAVLAAIGAGRVPERLPRPDRLDLIEGRIYF